MSAAALERQIRPIYDALDAGSNKPAIVACNKLLKKHPKNELIKALKALALIRSQKVEESLVLCDEVLECKPTDDAVLTAMMHVLRGLGRHNDMVTMFEEAFKKQPSNEELACQTFFANVRAGHWKSAHQVATRMFKTFTDDRYLYWSVICAVLQARDAQTPATMRPILYKLAHRLIASSSKPSYINADRFHLHLSILSELNLFEEAETLLDSEVGKSICATNLSCDEVRRKIWAKQGRTAQEGQRAEKLVLDQKDRNWLEFLAVLDAALPASTSPDFNPEDTVEKLKHAEDVFNQVVEADGLKDRSGLLALIELERRARLHGVSKDPLEIVKRLQRYFGDFGDKACYFEDLKPYLPLSGSEAAEWDKFIAGVPLNFSNVTDMRRSINILKVQRFSAPESEITVEKERARLAQYLKGYFEALPLGKDLPSTELQPADDLALLAGNALISLWSLTKDDSYLLSAVCLLEFAVTRSKQSFLARLILIRVYRLLGAPSQALEHYRAMQIKQVQHDTLSHLVLSRASTFSLASSGDLTFATECSESTQIYLSNSQETADFIVRAFTGEKYSQATSQIPEFITFEERLDNSLQRDNVKIEHLRMRLTHEPISSDLIDMEFIELKFLFDRIHHDNRDFAILPDYQPKSSIGLDAQTQLFGKIESTGWLSSFLKIYIRTFQQASDMDDTVEEKLLIGDRPKPPLDLQKKGTLNLRLRQKNDADLETLTTEERYMVEFVTEMANWLESYHDYARPPPAVVLAEAAKQTELKTGHPLKGIEIPANGAANGAHKKDEEPPAIIEPPQLVSEYFQKAKQRFAEVVQSGNPADILHAATLIQEAFLLFVVETTRFKSASVVKINKFGSLVAYFKPIRAEAAALLKDISASLTKESEKYASATHQVPADSVTKILSSHIDHDAVVTQSKKLANSRKQVLEGVAKGMSRLVTTYA